MSPRAISGLMTGVILVMLEDYRNPKSDHQKDKIRAKEERLRKFRIAEDYFFDDGRKSKEYVFGFRSICDYLKIDHRKIRRQLLKEKKGILDVLNAEP